MPINTPTGYLDITNATLRGSKIVTTGYVGIANANPTNHLSIGSNLHINDTHSNVLQISGNINASRVVLGGITIAPTFDLEGVTNTGNTTPYTLEFNNTATAFVTTANATIGDTLTASKLVGDGSGISAIQSSNVSDFGSNVTRITNLESSRALKTDLDNNSSRITNLSSNLSDNSTRITNLSSNLSDNSSRITTLESEDISISGEKTFTGQVIFESNIHMAGGNVLVANTINMTVSDPIIELGSNNLNTGDLGIVMTRHGDNSNVAFVYDESEDILRMGYTLNGASSSVVYLDSNALAVGVQGTMTADKIVASNVIPATSTTTGALTVAGGVGVDGNVHCTNLYANNITMNLVSFSGLQTFEQVVNNGRILNSNVLIISNATPSMSPTTGALTLTAGGLGVAGNVHAAKFKGDGSELTGIPWTESNSNIYYEANVAIGTSSVTSGARLEVKGPMRVSNLTNDHHTDLICTEFTTQPISVKIADGPATQQGVSGGVNRFGWSTTVSADGKTLAVGSWIASSNGGVFVYEGSGDSWTFKGRLKISGATATQNGWNVAISEDGSVIVCSGLEPSGTTTPKTFVYVRSGSNWTGDVANPTATLTGSHYIGTEAWRVDCDISKDGNTIVVGAGWDNYNNVSDSGTCAVYVKPSGGWVTTSTATRVLYASGSVASSDNFGWMTRISGDGNTIVASLSGVAVGGNADQGEALVYVKGSAWSGATQTETARLTQSDGVTYDTFSYLAIDISDDGGIIVACAAGQHTYSTGAAYVFMKPSGGWSTMTQNCKIKASDGVLTDLFGRGVSISGDASKIFIVASRDDDTGNNSGSVYVYNRPSTGWNASSTLSSHAFKLTLDDAQDLDVIGDGGFNNATDTTGSMFVTGSDVRNSNRGAAFVWKLIDTALEVGATGGLTLSGPLRLTKAGATADVTCVETSTNTLQSNEIEYPGTATAKLFGGAVAMSGDGTTMVVGTEHYGNSAQGGGAFVYEGSGTSWTFKGQLGVSGVSGYMAYWVSISEDGSVIVCTGQPAPTATASPNTFIYVRSGSNWTGNVSNPTATLTGSHYTGSKNWKASCDISKDGNTISVGNMWDDYNNQYQRGSVAVYVKPSGGWATTSTATREFYTSDGAASDVLGWNTRISGDGNTIVASAGGADNWQGLSDTGAVYVWVKGSAWSSATQTQTAKLTRSDDAGGDWFGQNCVSISDDGAIIAAGLISYNSYAGAAYVFVKPSGGWSNMTSESCRITASDGATNTYFGSKITISGDASKIIVGSFYTEAERGACYIYDRPIGNWNASSTLSTHTDKLVGSFVGDYVGDGWSTFSAIDDNNSIVVTGAWGRNNNMGAVIMWDLNNYVKHTMVRATGADGGMAAWNSPGSMFQVLKAVKTNTATTNSTSFVDTGLEVRMTPRTTTSKILVSYAANVGTNAHAFLRLVRVHQGSTTAIAIGDYASNRVQCTHYVRGYQNQAQELESYCMEFLDSPSTTSVVTYKLQFSTSNASYTVFINKSYTDSDDVNYGRGISTLTVKEIAQ